MSDEIDQGHFNASTFLKYFFLKTNIFFIIYKPSRKIKVQKIQHILHNLNFLSFGNVIEEEQKFKIC